MREHGKIGRWILIGAGLLAAGWILSAGLPAAFAVADPLPIEAKLSQAAGVSVTRTPAVSPSPEPGATRTSPPTASQTPTKIPLTQEDLGFSQPEDLGFSQPAAGVEVNSPIKIEADIYPAVPGSVRLELVSSDGRVLARKVFLTRDCAKGTKTSALQPVLVTNPSAVCIHQNVHLSTTLSFGISEEQAKARLQILLVDGGQHVRSQTSVGLTLLTVGEARPSKTTKESAYTLEILQPVKDGTNKGKTLIVSGRATITKDLPLRVEVVSESGGMINSRMASALAEKGAQEAAAETGTFTVEISLKKLKVPTRALVIVSAADEDVPGMKFVTSREVFLDPQP